MPGDRSSRRSRSRSRSNDRNSHRDRDSRDYRVRIRGRLRDTREVLSSSGTAPILPPPPPPPMFSRLGSFGMLSRGTGIPSRWAPGWAAPRGFNTRRPFVKPPVPPPSAPQPKDSNSDSIPDRNIGVSRNMLIMEVNPTYVPRGRFFEVCLIFCILSCLNIKL